jgi:hydrogenase nickel incorporation protein HypA/HybF
MHEEALLRDLRRKLEELAHQERASRITRVALWVGALAHVTPDTLRARWPETVAGTAAQGSALEIESSTDIHDPRAGGIVLTHVDVADMPIPGTAQ